MIIYNALRLKAHVVVSALLMAFFIVGCSENEQYGIDALQSLSIKSVVIDDAKTVTILNYEVYNNQNKKMCIRNTLLNDYPEAELRLIVRNKDNRELKLEYPTGRPHSDAKIELVQISPKLVYENSANIEYLINQVSKNQYPISIQLQSAGFYCEEGITQLTLGDALVIYSDWYLVD